ncbi:MAG: amidohydrolase family protein [Candidatus Bathyarchaeia archaeon]
MAGKVKAVFGGLLIDGTGREPLKDGVVLVEGDKIVAVGQRDDFQIPDGADIIDGNGLTLMPGMIDAHIHLIGMRRGNIIEAYNRTLSAARAVADAYTILEHGYTTARCCGSWVSTGVKRAIEEGSVKGPRLVVAGAAISQTFGHGDLHSYPLGWVRGWGGWFATLADGVDECRRAAREQLRENADFLKILTSGGVGSQLDDCEYPQYTLDEVKAIVYEAHSVGKKVASHAHGLAGIKLALEGDVDTFEHSAWLDEETAIEMARQNKIVVPTCYNPIRTYERTKGFTEQGDIPDWSFRKAQQVYWLDKKRVRMARKLGVKQAVATDWVGGSPYDVSMEMWALMELGGYTALEAISCCTKVGAECVGMLDKVGTLERGKLADLILVKGNPLHDIRVLVPKDNIMLVMKGGKVEVNRGLKTA